MQELVELIRRRAASAPLAKPKLRLVQREDLTDQPKGLDAQSRDVIYARIRDLSRMFWLQWLIRQETPHVQGILECLDDSELLSLLQKMERARECREDGDIGFVEAGLMKEVRWEL
jgi:hypothetical protein